MSSSSARSFAFIAHESTHLKDSNFVFVSDDATKIAFFFWRDGAFIAEIQSNWSQVTASNADHALPAFCQKIWLAGLKLHPNTLLAAGAIAQNLFAAYDGNQLFIPSRLGFGMRDLKELKWSPQETEAMVDSAGRQDNCDEDSTAKRYTCFGPGNCFLMEVKTSMVGDRNIIGYRYTDLDHEVTWEKRLYQAFVDDTMGDFLRMFDVRVLAPADQQATMMTSTQFAEPLTEAKNTFGMILRIALLMFDEAKAFINTPSNRDERRLLTELVKKEQFLRETVTWSTNSLPNAFTAVLDDPRPSPAMLSVKTEPRERHESCFTAFLTDDSSPQRKSQGSDETVKEKLWTFGQQPHRRSMAVSNERTEVRSTKAPTSSVAEDDICGELNQPKKSKNKRPKNNNKKKKKKTALGTPSTNQRSDHQDSDKTRDDAAGGGHEQMKGATPNDSRVSVIHLLSPVSSDSDRTITPYSFAQSEKPSIKRYRSQSTPLSCSESHQGMAIHNFEEQPTDREGDPQYDRTFKFDGFDSRLTCPLPECDPLVVICPACGPHSYTRYCCKQHLYDDLIRHWLYDCGRTAINGPVDEYTIRRCQIPKSAYITGHFANPVERHRQAVYRALEHGDYFIFDDFHQLEGDKPTKDECNSVRGSGKLQYVIRFPDPPTKSSEFSHHMMQCLKFSAPMASVDCDLALHMIREALVLQGAWTADILTDLCMQVAFEWAGYRVPFFFYDVQEANAIFHTYGLLPSAPVVRRH